MPRANIDLSWLAGLISPAPTAQTQANTPDADPGSVGKFLDPQFNDVSQPYQPPSKWQRMLHPEQSAQIDQLNNSFSARPLIAQQENQIKYGTALSNIARMPHSALPLGVSPTEAAATGYGTFQTPVELSQQNRAMANMEGGITPLQSSTDINVAKSNLESSNRALQRQPTVEAGLDQQAVNNLQKLLHVDEPTIRLAEMQVKADIGREPTYEEVREQTLKNQLREQKQLIPAQYDLSLTQTGNAQDVASKTHELMPYTTGTMANEAVGKLAQSRFQPLGEPFGNKIDGPMVTPGARNPLGMSPFQQQMQLMKDFTGQNVQELTLPSGKKVQVNVPTVDRSAFNPLDAGNTMKATNMDVPVTHDTSGSMSPPVIQPMGSTLQSRDIDYNNIRSPYLGNGQPTQEAVNESVGQELHKLIDPHLGYGGAMISSSPFAYSVSGGKNVDKESVVDWTTSKDFNKLPQATKKQILLLINKLQ